MTNLTPVEERQYDEMVNQEPNLPIHTILGQEFELDELRDIVNCGMSAGVSGFIYYHETTDKFDEHDDEIQDYLSDWVHDNIGGDEGSFAYFAKDVEDITQLKNKLVWAYVELKAHEILTKYDPNY
jgi:hypothetical protein